MKICLINVPNTYELVGNDPVVIKESQGVVPPLGLLYTASYINTKGTHNVSVIDAQVENLSHEELAERVVALKPDLVGLTAMTFTLVDCKLVIKAIRKRLNVPIVVGGPHTAIFPQECFNPNGLDADYVIVGEGEITLNNLATLIETKKLTRNSPQSERTLKQIDFIQDLDELPFASFDLVPHKKYYSVLSEETPTATLFTSRGCPFSCTYCDRPALGKGFRPQGAKRVVDEMEHLERHYGFKDIFFYDDTFSVSKKRVHEICDEYLKRNLSIKWDVRTRVNVVDDDLLTKMKKAGCTRIHFGVESGSPRVREEIQKGISNDQIERAFDGCRRLGIKTLAYFMLGNRTETFEDTKETLAMARRIKPDYMQMTILSPFPATQDYDIARRRGVIQGDPWREYANRINDDFRPPLYDEIYSRNELESQLRWFYRKFYLNPKFILDRVMEVRNPGQFSRYAVAGLSLLKMTLVPENKMKDSWQLRTKTGIASSKSPEAAVELA